MRTKKTPKANLENKKALFIQFGLIIALSITIFAFEYRSYEQKDPVFISREVVDVIPDIVSITQEEPQLQKPEEISNPKTTEFDVVDDNIVIKNEWNMNDILGNENIATTFKKIVIETPEETLKDGEDEIFKIVEDEAEFPGGYEKLQEYLSQSIKYPKPALETGAEGTVMLTFVVEKDGSITDIKILRDAGSGLGEEAIRVVREMPKWKPAKQRTKVVRQQFNLPVKFKLNK
ncbi:MAG: TonB family protein [Bacteroidetes bacterium]|nr:TonB family protein [Bacteroidota bacterium]